MLSYPPPYLNIYTLIHAYIQIDGDYTKGDLFQTQVWLQMIVVIIPIDSNHHIS